MQAATAIALIVLLRRFPSVLDYTTFAIVLATMADTAALYALRRRHPRRDAAVPRVGLSVGARRSTWSPTAQSRSRCCGDGPLECATALAVTATALPAYAWFVGGAATDRRGAARAG